MKQKKISRAQVYAALKGWHKNSEKPESLLNDSMLVRRQLDQKANQLQQRFATNKVLHDGVNRLKMRNEVEAEILQKRFHDGSSINRTANSLGLGDDQLNRRQREAITNLWKILSGQEEELRAQLQEEIERSLPTPSYKQLFGFDKIQPDLVAQLANPSGHNVICITGIGGIGKTSLADSAVRAIIPHFYFDNIIWLHIDSTLINGSSITSDLILDVVSAELVRKLLPDLKEPLVRDERHQRIRSVLTQNPYFVVIDNVETNADTSVLLQHLGSWAGSMSKFLVTTRTRLTGQAAILSYDLSELSEKDAAKLIKQQAKERKLHDFANDVESVIADIYEATGGNPLALKLVVSLVSFMPLTHVLKNLYQGDTTDDVGKMYTRIYWQAWQTLTDNARDLLQAMPLVGEEGGEVEQLEAVSGLTNGTIWAAITDLLNRSLIEVRGDYRQRLYGIHRLTMTFLQTEIIGGSFDFS